MQTEVLVQLLNAWVELKTGQTVIDAEIWDKVIWVKFNFGRCTFVSRKKFNRRLLLENIHRESDPSTVSEPTRHFKCLSRCRDAIAASTCEHEKVASALNKLERYLDDRVNVGLIRRCLDDLIEAFAAA